MLKFESKDLLSGFFLAKQKPSQKLCILEVLVNLKSGKSCWVLNYSTLLVFTLFQSLSLA